MKNKTITITLIILLFTLLSSLSGKEQTDAQASATPNWNKDKKVVISEELKKRINFRFDMGFTPEGFNFYFNLLEAF